MGRLNGEPMNFQLERGKALAIVGPQGAGKTTLARKIASEHGTYSEINARNLRAEFALGRVLRSDEQTLIIEDCWPFSPARIDYLRDLIVCEIWTLPIMHGATLARPAPLIIMTALRTHPIIETQKMFVTHHIHA